MSRLHSAKSVLIVLVSLWLAGAGCLIGCEGMMTAAAAAATDSANDLATVVSGEACASKSHDCCSKHHAKTRPQPTNTAEPITTSGPASSGMEDCPLAATRTVLTSSGRRALEQPVLVNSSRAVAITFDSPETTRSLSTHLQLPNRGHTYLRCCVFLI